MYNSVEFLLRAEGKAVEEGLAEGAARGLLSRLCVVDSTDAALIVAPVGILSVANDNARVQQRAAHDPEHGRYLAGREKVVDVDLDLGPLKRESAAVGCGALAGRLGTRGGRHGGRMGGGGWVRAMDRVLRSWTAHASMCRPARTMDVKGGRRC